HPSRRGNDIQGIRSGRDVLDAITAKPVTAERRGFAGIQHPVVIEIEVNARTSDYSGVEVVILVVVENRAGYNSLGGRADVDRGAASGGQIDVRGQDGVAPVGSQDGAEMIGPRGNDQGVIPIRVGAGRRFKRIGLTI